MRHRRFYQWHLRYNSETKDSSVGVGGKRGTGKSASKSCGLICGHALTCETALIAVMEDFQRADN